jgi:serine/threonine protein phosphatase 1
MGLIAIGDIHGCARTLAALLERIGPTADDHLVFVGDYIDRGPDSKGVIDLLLGLRTRQRCTFLRGNHEALFLNYLDEGEFDIWSYNGGTSTLDSYAVPGEGFVIPEEHVAFIRETVMYLDTEDFFFVHAGLRPDRSIADNMRDADEMVYLWERGHLRMEDDELPWEKPVICGHTPVPEAVNRPKLINIDTGCVYFMRPTLGYLTAVRLPGRDFVSVPFMG